MFLENNKNALIDDKPEKFANNIIDLYNNFDLWQKLQDNSELSLQPFSREHLITQIKKI